MRVISVPSADPWAHQDVCSTCSTTLELEVDDLRRFSDQRDGDNVVWRCPTCNSQQWRDTAIVPPHVRHKLRNR